MKILVLTFLKRSNFDAFFRTSTLKTVFFQYKSWLGYEYIEESFDTIFKMGYGRGVQHPPPSMDYGSGKSPMDERVNNVLFFQIFILFPPLPGSPHPDPLGLLMNL